MTDNFDHKDYYDRRASEYEQIYFRDMPAKRKEIDNEAARLVELVKDRNVLDIACGTGYWTKVISQTAASITATDLSPNMIEEAKRKEFKTIPNFVLADLNKLPFEPASFDFLALGFWFSHHPLQDYENFFNKLKTLLKPNGQIWMIDNNPPAEGPKFSTVGSDDHGNNYKKRFLDNGEEFVVLKNYFTESELIDIFSAHFEIMKMTYGKYYWSIELKLQ